MLSIESDLLIAQLVTDVLLFQFVREMRYGFANTQKEMPSVVLAEEGLGGQWPANVQHRKRATGYRRRQRRGNNKIMKNRRGSCSRYKTVVEKIRIARIVYNAHK